MGAAWICARRWFQCAHISWWTVLYRVSATFCPFRLNSLLVNKITARALCCNKTMCAHSRWKTKQHFNYVTTKVVSEQNQITFNHCPYLGGFRRYPQWNRLYNDMKKPIQSPSPVRRSGMSLWSMGLYVCQTHRNIPSDNDFDMRKLLRFTYKILVQSKVLLQIKSCTNSTRNDGEIETEYNVQVTCSKWPNWHL